MDPFSIEIYRDRLADSVKAQQHLHSVRNSLTSMEAQRALIHHLLPSDKSSDSAWWPSSPMFRRVTTRVLSLLGWTVSDKKPTEFSLSPIDMLMPRMHVPKLLYFASTAEPADLISNLMVALELTLKSMPIIAGSVATSKQDGVQKGSLSVQSPFLKAEDILSANDLRDEYDYEQLRAAHFPTDMVAFDAVAPKLFGKAADSAPVMVAQVNFLRGGVLLFLGFHHCVLDEVGIFNVMRVWSSYCRGEVGLDFVTPQWFDRSALSQGTGTGRLEDHLEYSLAPEGAMARAAEDPSVFFPSPADVHSGIFFFSDEALGRLKLAATVPSLGDGLECTTWISTNDALTALFWCCISSARVAESKRATSEIFPLFAMAVNGRNQLHPPMSPDYCGNVVLIAKHIAKADDLLIQEPGRLANAASLIRKAVNVVDDAYIRDVIQMVRKTDNIGRLAPRRRPAVEHSLGCTTWARQPYYSLDWGSVLGGACERVRGRNMKTDGVIVIFPRIPPSASASAGSLKKKKKKEGSDDDDGVRQQQGGIEVQLSLRSGPYQRLIRDPVLMAFAQWRCS